MRWMGEIYVNRGMPLCTTFTFLRYMGTDSVIYPEITLAFPREFDILLEAFGGSGTVSLNHPCKVKIYNDLDIDIYNIFYHTKHNHEEVIRHLMKYYKFAKKLIEGGSKEDFYRSIELSKSDFRVTAKNAALDLIYYNIGPVGTVEFVGAKYKLGTLIRKVREAHKRLQNVKVWNMDYRRIIGYTLRNISQSERLLIYLDPPFFQESGGYGISWNKYDFMKFATFLNKIKHLCLILIKHNPHRLVRTMFKGWNYIVLHKRGRLRGTRYVPVYLITNYEIKLPFTTLPLEEGRNP